MMTLVSPNFNQGEAIPKKYSCQGKNVNPALVIGDVPAKAKSLVLILDDPDVPKNLQPDGLFTHWLVFNMPAATTKIDEASIPPGTQGSNSAGKPIYTGPCPPDGEHRYFFRLYALDTLLNLSSIATKTDVLGAMQDHVLEQTELMGKYDKE